MTAKEYLSQIRTLDSIIEQKCRELDNLHDIATAIGSFDYSKDRVQTSPNGEAPYAKTAEKAAELDVEIRALEDERLKIIDSIYRLKDKRYVEILYRHYVDGERFEDIADGMNYNLSYVYEMHNDALEKLTF